jgi:hypothetical protein
MIPQVSGYRTNSPKSSPEYREEFVQIKIDNVTLRFTSMEQIKSIKLAINTAEKMLSDIIHKRDLIEKL